MKNNIDNLRQTLFKHDGKVFLPIDIDEHLAKYLHANGQFFGPADVHLQGIPGQCHYMAEFFWRLNRTRYTIYTGAALMGAAWVGHSWLVDRQGKPVETSEPAV